MSIDDRLAELGIVMPETTVPVANYVTSRQTGNLLFLSGHLGKRDGAVVTGKLGEDLETDAGYDLARNAAIDLIATARAALGTLDTVAVVKLTGLRAQRSRLHRTTRRGERRIRPARRCVRAGARPARAERHRSRAAAARRRGGAGGDLRGHRRTGIVPNR